MIEQVKHVRNPLTVIAMFAAIAEVSGSVVLPLLSDGRQDKFVWFVMIFPALLVLLFFLTLLFKHEVLYAPSDFKDDRSFLDLIRPLNPSQQKQRIEDEIKASAFEPTEEEKEPQAKKEESKRGPASEQVPNIRLQYAQSEDLVIRKLESELGIPFQRQVRVGSHGIGFDGVAVRRHDITLVEIKFVSSLTFSAALVQQPIFFASGFGDELKKLHGPRVSLILAIVTNLPHDKDSELMKKLNMLVEDAKEAMIAKGLSKQIELRLFHLDELQKIFGVIE